MRLLRCLLRLGLLLLAAPAFAQPKIAIIIDDLGYNRTRGEAIINLPGAVTCAVIPQTPHAPHLARKAREMGKEVILHMPMETEGYDKLDEGGLRDDMPQEEFLRTVNAAIQRIPEATGLNNHMGGVLTANETAMTWLMDALVEHQLFFVDSRTTAQSVARKVAQRQGLAHAGRDIFLDNERDMESMNEQFNRALAIARRRGHAIIIGHPYPETIEYLQNVLPLLAMAGIELVPVSQLLNRRQVARVKDPEQGVPAL
ncbi:MAG: hypothetical protein CVV10_00075 [Gammaproteobacteria bacterium HGW-Gammaproteobacteria-14]|nr:MAG: hypothetical protein CVV10_00075 [Gammaproteobacteria bacterium HGW-Gammaproteobacteria-14]